MRSKLAIALVLSVALLLACVVAGAAFALTRKAADAVPSPVAPLGCCETGDCCCPGQGACCDQSARVKTPEGATRRDNCCVTGDCCCPGHGDCCGSAESHGKDCCKAK